MEEDFETKMEDLRGQFASEKAKKAELDKELAAVKQELADIETKFPKEV